MTGLEQLLAVQEHDTRLDQLHHRRATLPQRATLADLERTLQAHDREADAVREQRDALAREQKRLEDEVAAVEEKATEVDKTLYSGTITSPRELQGFQAELEALRRRQRQLEDEVLALMEQLEPLDDDLSRRAEERARIVEQVEQVRNELEAAEREVDAAIEEEQRARADTAAPLPEDVLQRYERLRTQHEGVAIARLVGNSCGGCHLTLSAVELDRIKHEPPDALIFCEECGRLLVR